MENTKIEWTATRLPDGTVKPGHTFNPWEGCAKVSPGCKNCYADAQHSLHHSSLKRQQGTCWGVASPRMAKSADNWKKPLKWNREAAASGVRARVFCASMADASDWFTCTLVHSGRIEPSVKVSLPCAAHGHIATLQPHMSFGEQSK